MPRYILFLLFLLLPLKEAGSWGFWAHKRINNIAIYTLPPELFAFYKANIEYITEAAVNPDRRRYAVKGEAPKHYIDLDHYGEYPFTDFPRRWEDAENKYSKDSLEAYGILPWNLEWMMYRLTDAFKKQDVEQILRLSADLGHYIGDAHVPLHTTHNYNGQMTGQYGIHGFWESRIPELYGEQYDYFVGKAAYIKDLRTNIWEVILESHRLVDSVLLYEQQLTASYPSDQKYSYEQRLSTTVRVYSEGFTYAYNDMMDGMVERRMRQAIIATGSYWMTAWVLAGQPDLTGLEQKVMALNADTVFTPLKGLKVRDHHDHGWE